MPGGTLVFLFKYDAWCNFPFKYLSQQRITADEATGHIWEGQEPGGAGLPPHNSRQQRLLIFFI